ncbi:MAG: hypothetical protein DRQ24_06010 [Candidatus Latescibacterota bacterium]|nr:MAG: hypothetical protein DRQ24_06010 [Candidatus Latescibacterota bacterium]
MKNIVIYENEKSYSAFPDIEHLQNGDLVVAFREAVRRRMRTHLDTTSKAVLVRSADGGKTWGTKVTIYNDECSIQGPSLVQLEDGTLVANFFKWRVGDESSLPAETHDLRRLGEESYAWTEGTFVIRSYDGGYTWENEPIKVTSPTGNSTYTSDAVLELPDGELLIPLEGKRPGETERALVMRSQDKGETWQDASTVAYDPFGNLSFHEPALLALPSGKIICMLRVHGRATDPEGYYLYQSESQDGGRTWSTPQRTDIWGHPAHLLYLKNGKVLCAYGYRRPPYGVRACLSEDEGKTWNLKDEIIIRSDGKDGDLGYPSSVQLSDGRILTVYYFHPLDEDWSEGHSLIAGSFYRETERGMELQ